MTELVALTLALAVLGKRAGVPGILARLLIFVVLSLASWIAGVTWILTHRR
jgi:hypothetical protein